MINLGISIYPNKSDLEKDLAYIELAAKYNVKRVFTNLLGLGDRPKDIIIKEFKERIDFAKAKGMEVIVDVSPSVFSDLGLEPGDLSFFKEINADGIRMDEAFNGNHEALMSFNEYDLKLEVNASTNVAQIESVLAFNPNLNKLISSHNFYPQKYTGLSYAYFKENSEKVRNLNIEISAFISSNNDNVFGPWDFNEGLVTLEEHRYYQIDLQARHLVATRLIDNLTIANAYASEAEFESLKNIKENQTNLKIDLAYELSDVEKEILYHPEHFVRGDISDYMRRSTMTRVYYADESIKPQNTVDLEPGDLVILNDNFGRYKGELHIVLKAMKNDGNKNVVGKVKKEELFLLDYLIPWSHFTILK